MKLTLSEIADIVIGLLAAEQSVSASALRIKLEAAGPQLPVDSLLVAEILTKVEAACGVRIHVDAEAARSTRSVMTFAWTVYRALRKEGVGRHE
jgi:acyl carrier protein